MKAVDYFKIKYKTTPCPYCKSKCKICITLNVNKEKRRAVHCTKCTYCSIAPAKSPRQAIVAHEKLCDCLDLADKVKELIKNPPFQKIDMIDTIMTYEEVEQADAHNNGIWACLDMLRIEGKE